jgi:hypothetical protein
MLTSDIGDSAGRLELSPGWEKSEAFCDQDPRERVQDRRDRISVGSVAHDLSEGASQFPSIHQSPVRCFIATPGSWKNPKGIQKDEW